MRHMELTERDRRVIATIEQIRDEHHACTATAVAVRLKISKAYMFDVMHDMIERDLLIFNPEITGSLRVTDAVRAELFPAETTAVRHVCNEPGCDWPTEPSLVAHQRRVH